MDQSLQGIADLPHLGIIRAEGEDAAKFLHGQLTQDFSLLGLSEARLAAFCSAKGRMLASFIAFKRSHTDIVLLCSRDLLAPTLKRLSMFVLRAKVKLSDASDEFICLGLAGKAVPQPSARPWVKTDSGSVSIISLYPAEGVARALWLAPIETTRPEGLSLSSDIWLWGDVRSGIASITAPVVDSFVPQMLNYESVGGVNFKKGCYPGQEVVARSQFRGTLKRRGYLLHSEVKPDIGDEIYQPSDPDQPCGTIAQSASAPAGGYDAIASLQISAAQGPLHLRAANGPALTLLPLPYPLIEDI